jgi:hypothetical protein
MCTPFQFLADLGLRSTNAITIIYHCLILHPLVHQSELDKNGTSTKPINEIKEVN